MGAKGAQLSTSARTTSLSVPPPPPSPPPKGACFFN